MANKKITDLMSGTPARDSLFESAIDISGTMDSRKVIAGAIADLASANVAAAYNSATTYAIGQYCLYEGDIYRCIAITTGTFDATKWTQIVVTSEFRRVVELTTAQYEALSSAEQNNGTLYILTDGTPPSETITGSDIIPFIDVSDSNKPKSTTAAAVAATALTPKDVSSSVTKYTNIDYFEKSVVRCGNVVCVYISFSFSTTPVANNIIAENLPKAFSNMLLLCECTSGSNNGKASRVMVNSYGRVLDWYSSGFFGTGMNYSIIGSYITNDPI